jgi:hypothetical protein
MRTLFLILLLAVSSLSSISAQQRIIKGTVSDENKEPLFAVTVAVERLGVGVSTDLDGKFKLKLPNEDIELKFTFLGYLTKTIILAKAKDFTKVDTLHIQLEPNTATLDEVVVTSYSLPSIEADHTTAGKPFKERRVKALAATPAGVSSEPTKFKSVLTPETYEEVYVSDDSPASPDIGAGVLTAGSLNDFNKWDLWKDISEEDLAEWKDTWKVHPKDRYSIQLTNQQGNAVITAKVKLLNRKKEILWQGVTDNTGKAELWVNINTEIQDKAHSIEVEYQGQNYPMKDIQSFQKGINILKLPVECQTPSTIDIAFVVDATGSMADEINYLKVELNDVISRVQDSLPATTINLGSIFYRDVTDAYLVKQSPLSSNINQTIQFIQKQTADGGGDTPEAVESALDSAIHQLDWNDEAVAKLIFLVLDAPPHQSPEVVEKMNQLMKTAAQKGIRIIPVACSGTDKSTEYLMRSLALGTNGNYLFLTDDSGIGNPHIEPTTDEYEVKKFNELLIETIIQMSTVKSCDEMIEIADLPVDTLQVQTDNPVDENNAQISWKYFPNPTMGLVNIEIQGEIGALYLSDFTGKILQRIEVGKNEQLQIDISPYPAGTYFLKYQDGEDNWLSGKLILVHS